MPLWDGIRSCTSSVQPWAIGGDFNVVAASSEKVGGNPPDQNALADFSDRILDCNMIDIGFVGLPFT